ncbi:MAG: glycosyltransferase [Flavobacteriales bacterium]|nr:glycosyltransferase [Flavobacteriales bacterium]
MTISAFTFVRNAKKYNYPMTESIMSIIDIVDEYVIAVGDSSDDTLESLKELQKKYPKIKLVETVWDTEKYPNASVYAQQTDLAKMQCTGDWLFYLQSDEVVHEKFLPEIKEKCAKYLNDKRVEGFIFHYEHFWGDFQHITRNHSFYPYEMRIVRNLPNIHSWRDAQSFRIFPQKNEFLPDYFVKKGTKKLHAIQLDAFIYHYGWARHPSLMSHKDNMAKRLYTNENGEKGEETFFDYGNMNSFPVMKFHGVQPSVMMNYIINNHWNEYLRNEGKRHTIKTKHLIISFIEQYLLGPYVRIGGFNNFIRLRK